MFIKRFILIFIVGLLLVLMIAYGLQAASPSWRDLMIWAGWMAVLIAALTLLIGASLWVTRYKALAKDLLLNALLFLLIAVVIFIKSFVLDK